MKIFSKRTAIAMAAIGSIIFIAVLAGILELFGPLKELIYTCVEGKPRVENLSVIAGANDSLLIGWETTTGVDSFIVHYENDGQEEEFSTSDIVVPIRSLVPNTDVKIDVTPVRRNVRFPSATLEYSLEKSCTVRSIITEDAGDGVLVRWNYSGVDEGFIVSISECGTSSTVYIIKETAVLEKGCNSYRFGKLKPGVKYTVKVTPRTLYPSTAEYTFKNGEFRRFEPSFSNLKVKLTEDVYSASALKEAAPLGQFGVKVSGRGKVTEDQEKVELGVYIFDEDKNFVSYYSHDSVLLNPMQTNKNWSVRRAFIAPEKAGSYRAYVTVNDCLAGTAYLKVVD